MKKEEFGKLKLLHGQNDFFEFLNVCPFSPGYPIWVIRIQGQIIIFTYSQTNFEIMDS